MTVMKSLSKMDNVSRCSRAVYSSNITIFYYRAQCLSLDEELVKNNKILELLRNLRFGCLFNLE